MVIIVSRFFVRVMLGEGGNKVGAGIFEHYFNSFVTAFKIWGFVNFESSLISLFIPLSSSWELANSHKSCIVGPLDEGFCIYTCMGLTKMALVRSLR